MNNKRVELNIELGKLKPTDHLESILQKKVMNNVVVERKHDGRRYSFQVGPEGNWLTSKSRHGKTKGVAHSSAQPFVLGDMEPWMHNIKCEHTHVFDCELVTVDNSTSTMVSRKDTEKKLVAFDLLVYAGFDVRNSPLSVRVGWMHSAISQLSGGSKDRIELDGTREFYGTFTIGNLNYLLNKARGEGIEGYVVKQTDKSYTKVGYGWKVKPEDTIEAWVTDVEEEFKHHLGVRTRTGRVGTVELSMYKMVDGVYKIVPVGWVPLPEEMRYDLKDTVNIIRLQDTVIRFKHWGWTGSDFRFPKFVEVVTDKKPTDCVFSETTKVTEEE